MSSEPAELSYANRVDGRECFVDRGEAGDEIRVEKGRGIDWRLLLRRDWLFVMVARWIQRMKGERLPLISAIVDGRQIYIVDRTDAYEHAIDFRIRRTASVQVRANRYESGLYIDAPGQAKMTILESQPKQLIDWLAKELNAAMERHPSGAASSQTREVS